MRRIRKQLGLSSLQLGRAFGYSGSDAATAMAIRRFETGGRALPVWLGRLMEMFEMHGVPLKWTASPSSDPPSPPELNDVNL